MYFVTCSGINFKRSPHNTNCRALVQMVHPYHLKWAGTKKYKTVTQHIILSDESKYIHSAPDQRSNKMAFKVFLSTFTLISFLAPLVFTSGEKSNIISTCCAILCVMSLFIVTTNEMVQIFIDICTCRFQLVAYREVEHDSITYIPNWDTSQYLSSGLY